MTDANSLPLEAFYALPSASPDRLGDIGSIVLVPMPTDELHDSGFRAMAFAPCDKQGVPIGLMSGHSDVLHIEGIGGMGQDWLNRYKTCPRLVPPTGWSIDCLAGSGLMRLFPSSDFCDRIAVSDFALSSFEIWGHLRADRDPRPTLPEKAS